MERHDVPGLKHREGLGTGVFVEHEGNGVHEARVGDAVQQQEDGHRTEIVASPEGAGANEIPAAADHGSEH